MFNFQFIRKNSEYKLVAICFCILFLTLLMEYLFNFPPCKLCLYQRIPFILGIIFGVVFIFFKKIRLFFLVFLILQLANLVIALFHSLVERGIVNYEMSCTSTGSDIQTIEDLRSFLDSIPITKCNEILFSIMGLSLANLNVIISILLIVWTYVILKFYEKK
mgnify:CR=1 FL=1